MPEGGSFRQVDEKHVSTEVKHMVWSPKMDLLAVANLQGEVVLYRLSWQKVWTLTPGTDDVRVAALAWRPDGKVLAVGYTTGKVLLCDVENSSVLHTLQSTSSVSCMSWVSESISDDVTTSTAPPASSQTTSYLPRLPQFAKSYTPLSKVTIDENVEDAKRLKGLSKLSILVVGTEDGHLCMYAFGIFPMCVADLNQHGIGKSGRVMAACLSDDMQMVSLMVESVKEDGETKEVNLISFDTTLLASRHQQLSTLALKFGDVLTLMAYLDSTIQQMSEAWEDILLEMDSKLMKFAQEKHKVCGGSVSNDFLRLLMLGTPSDELKTFLLYDLTEKGLKKLGHSIENSYSNIQKLVLKHLQTVGQALVYHLADLKGMSLWYDKFGVLGLCGKAVQQAVSVAGSFMLKASELQQVIDGSMKNFKAFFRWLYVVIQRLSEEAVPIEISKMTQQDLNFVAQFLNENFTEPFQDEEGSPKGFKLEKVGQYLKNEDLTDPPDNSNNPWVEFLRQQPSIQASPLLYPGYMNKSLCQLHEMLSNSLDAILSRCSSVIGQSLHCVSTTYLYNPPPSDDGSDFPCRISQFSKTIEEKAYLYTAYTCDHLPCDMCYIIRQATSDNRQQEAAAVSCGRLGSLDDSTASIDRCGLHTIVDLAFYNAETLSLLLQEEIDDGCPVLAQIPLVAIDTDCFIPLHDDAIDYEFIKSRDVGADAESLGYRRLENVKACCFAVSGTRNAACVLFSSRRRVRLFLMDAEDEEEEDEDDEEGSPAQDTPVDVSQQQDANNSPWDETRADEDKENSKENVLESVRLTF